MSEQRSANERCMAAGCDKDAIPGAALCEAHYNALPGPMRGEAPSSNERCSHGIRWENRCAQCECSHDGYRKCWKCGAEIRRPDEPSDGCAECGVTKDQHDNPDEFVPRAAPPPSGDLLNECLNVVQRWKFYAESSNQETWPNLVDDTNSLHEKLRASVTKPAAQIMEHPDGADSQTRKLGALRNAVFGPAPIPGHEREEVPRCPRCLRIARPTIMGRLTCDEHGDVPMPAPRAAVETSAASCSHPQMTCTTCGETYNREEL